MAWPEESVRVVLVSPGNVADERNTAQAIIDDVNQRVAADGGRVLSLWRWNTDASPGVHLDGPHGQVDALTRIEDADLVVGVFWTRFGMPTPDAISGTELELRRAWDARQRDGGPEVVLYFSSAPYSPQSDDDPGQWSRLVQFRDELPAGQLKTYASVEEFATLLHADVTRFVLQLGAVEGGEAPARAELFPSWNEDSQASDSLRDSVAPVADPFDLVASAVGDLPASEDLLGFEPLVRALYALLDDEKTVLPLAIAVTAAWGAGKSSVMRQLKALMDAKPPAVVGDDQKFHRNWKTVHFAAWKYERGERLWAALVKAIYDQSQERLSLPAKVAFRVRLELRRLGPWKLVAVTLVPLLAVTTAVVAALSAGLRGHGSAIGLTAATLVLGTASRYGAMIVNPFRRAIEKYAQRPDVEAHLGFTAQADSEIRKLVSLLAPGPTDGLAVFVDDLDRCSSAHVVEVVEAMNQIFNAADTHRCVFILGLDRDVVAANINVAYGDTVAELKRQGNPLGDRFGAEFLAKLVQLTVAIPPPDAGAMRRLMESVIGSTPAQQPVSEVDVQRTQDQIRQQSADETLEGIEHAADSLRGSATPEVVVEATRRERALRIKDSPAVFEAELAALPFLEPNPRQLKRFHNAFRLQLYVASEDDRVTFDFSPDQLAALARWVALRLRWPRLADAIAHEPDLLALLEREANDDSVVELDAQVIDTLSTRHGEWLDNVSVLALVREQATGRRLAALRLDSFVGVT